MNLVDEQDYVLELCEFLEHVVQTLFKRPAVLGSGQQPPDVKFEHPVSEQNVVELARCGLDGQTLGQLGFAHARLPDEDGVVLGFSGQNLQQVKQFLLASDDGFEPALPGLRRQVAGQRRQYSGSPLPGWNRLVLKRLRGV